MKDKNKPNLLVSFSGGETSAYMMYFISKYWQNKFNIHYLFANTGEEHEETLKFIENCCNHFNILCEWLEYDLKDDKSHFKIVDYNIASRNGEPFEKMIGKNGIPNSSYPHCTRDLKLEPMKKYVRTCLLWKDYYTAVGIRADEVDRVSAKRKEFKLLYPLVTEVPMSKQKINFWWSQMPFRLNLKGYQGNCKTCWKKSNKKLETIASENPEWFDNFKKWEKKYSRYFPESQNRPEDNKIRFFRNHRTVDDILEAGKNIKRKANDDHRENSYQTQMFDESESCDIYSNCGE